MILNLETLQAFIIFAYKYPKSVEPSEREVGCLGTKGDGPDYARYSTRFHEVGTNENISLPSFVDGLDLSRDERPRIVGEQMSSSCPGQEYKVVKRASLRLVGAHSDDHDDLEDLCVEKVRDEVAPVLSVSKKKGPSLKLEMRLD